MDINERLHNCKIRKAGQRQTTRSNPQATVYVSLFQQVPYEHNLKVLTESEVLG